MKAIYADPKSNGDLVLGDVPRPEARGKNLLVKVHACSLNPHDWQYYGWFKNNLYSKPLPLPKLRVGHDVSGEVIAVGKGVKHFKVGDEVYGMSAKPVAFAEYIAIDYRTVAHKPAGLTHVEAATIPMAALTAIQALRITKLTAGSHVLIIGGSGGVGSSAVQIAKAQGARVTAVCSGKNQAFVKSFGADAVIDYTRNDFHACGEKFDIVFDTIGGESAESCREIMGTGGHFISTKTSLANVLEIGKSRSLALLNSSKVKAGTLLAMPRGSDLEAIRVLVEAGKIKPNVDKVFALSQVAEAMTYSQRGRTRGKIAIEVAGNRQD